MGISEQQLSKEAADQLVSYLYRLIDDIQFSQPYRRLEANDTKNKDQANEGFDDPIPFGNE